MEALDRVFASVCSLLAVTIVVIQFGCKVPWKFCTSGLLFWETRCP